MREIVVDNFAGGGGASTGIELATGRSPEIAINHDPAAIAMHRANHPESEHYQESVWDVDPVAACKGRPVGLAWFSPDCKHFSKAKGGKPKDKTIRGLAWVAVRWAHLVRPRVIMLENVEEFQTWGPLDDDGLPIKARAGETFRQFVAALRKHGYTVDWRELRACDYGAPTSRKRFFLIARCDGQPIVWPEATYADPNGLEVRSGKLLPWRTAGEIIDWSHPCPSIFERERPLAENTMRRIARGIQRFVIEADEPYIVNDRAGCLIQYHSETATDHVRGQTLDTPIMTVDSSNRYGLVAAFLAKHFGGNYTGPGASLDDPAPTVTAVDHNALVTSHIIKFHGENIGHPTAAPLQTITASGQHFGEVRAFLMAYYGNADDIGQSCREPLRTVVSKDRFGLVEIHGEDYQIVDIGMRMLQPRELFDAQGFPNDYIIDRDADGRAYPKTEQVARCGNAVPPPLPAAMVRANLPEMCGDEAQIA